MEDSGKQVQLDCADEEIVARVAAIDVAKDSGMVCTRVPHPTSPRRRTTTVWSVPARTSTIMNLAERLAGDGIERVVLESTSEYWRPFYYLLEARGLTMWVVNACEVKNVPGRPKTDRDARRGQQRLPVDDGEGGVSSVKPSRRVQGLAECAARSASGPR